MRSAIPGIAAFQIHDGLMDIAITNRTYFELIALPLKGNWWYKHIVFQEVNL